MAANAPGCTCYYAGRESEIIPPCDGGPVAFVVRGYWRGEGRKKHGPDMYLCEAHGTWSMKINPLGLPRERLSSEPRK